MALDLYSPLQHRHDLGSSAGSSTLLRRLPVVGVSSSGKITSSTQGRVTMREPVFNETVQLGIVVRDLPLYPVSRYCRQGKPMEGESRWKS
jgi:hypothetical protein